MEWAVVGAGGMLGSHLVERLQGQNQGVKSFSRVNMDLALPSEDLAESLKDANVIINCVAYTSVDKAESDEDGAFYANATVPAKLAATAAMVGARFIHVSTDYVFDGQASEPYKTNAKPNPQTVYGKSKWAGEESSLAFPNTQVVRTSWLYGKAGDCFPKTIARRLLAGEALRVVDDQIGSPTSTLELAEFLIRLGLSGNPTGSEPILHGVCSGQASWFEFAQSIADSLDLLDSAAKPAGVKSFRGLLSSTDTQSYPTPVQRPAFSVLEPSDVDGYQMPNWKTAWQAASKSVLDSL